MLPNPDPASVPGPAALPAVVPSPSPGPIVVLPPVAAAPVTMGTLDPIALLKALRRRWVLATCVGLALAVVVMGVAYAVVPPAKYTARAMLHVNSVPPRLIIQTRETYTDYQAYQRTQLALIKSRLVLNEALKRNEGEAARLPDVVKQADPVEWLEKELQVDFANGSEILRVSASGSEARVPMVLVNTAVAAYLDEVVDVETKQRRDRFELLSKTWDEYQRNMAEKRKELKRLMELAGADDKKLLSSLRQQGLDRLGRAEDELARVQSELRNLNVELEVLRQSGDQPAQAVTEAMIAESLDGDRAIETLAAQAALARRRLDDLSRRVRATGDPAVQRARRDHDAAQAALAAQRRKLYPIVAEQLRERARGNPAASAAPLELRVKILAGLEATLNAEVRRLSERDDSVARTSVDLFSIQEEIANAESVSKTIGTELEALKLELKAPPRVRLLEKAELPRTKDEMRPFKMAGLAGLGAFAAVLAGVSFWEFRAQRVDSVDEVVHRLGLQLVGTLPPLPRGRRMLASGGRDARWEGLLIESVDAVRTNLLHASRAESIQVVMVASALGGEGKTSLSGHLATSLARAGRRTLLVDGDLRRPSAHRLFDLSPAPGLAELLRGEAAVDDAIRPTDVEGVWLLPAGHADKRAIQALAHDDLRRVLDQCRNRFDFIVVDSSPILPVVDPLLIGQHVDAVLFAILRDVSRVPLVRAAYGRMASLGIRMLGAVVAAAPEGHYGSRYQDYYHESRTATTA